MCSTTNAQPRFHSLIDPLFTSVVVLCTYLRSHKFMYNGLSCFFFLETRGCVSSYINIKILLFIDIQGTRVLLKLTNYRLRKYVGTVYALLS